MPMAPFDSPKGSDPAGYGFYVPRRDLHANRHTEGAPTKVTDLYNNRGETIDGSDHSSSRKGKM